MRALLLIFLIGSVMGCGTATPPIDAARDDAGSDAGTDAGSDAGSDGGTDASDFDVGLDADDAGDDAGSDASVDATDAFVPTDIGPFDSGITRTADPPTHPSATPIAPFTECTVSTFTDTHDGAEHHTPCDVIPYPYYPPSSGPHYYIWADYETYTSPVPWPFLVHNLEHGAIVFAYNCENDADCDPVRAAFADLITAQGIDDVCRAEMESNDSRFVVVPAPDLPVPIAAIAWDHLYEATCLDMASLQAFVTAHYGMGSESLCDPGTDGSDGGWCP